MLKQAFVLIALATLGACASGKPRERINPPTVSLQELRIDGNTCTALIRVHNHSSVVMHYNRLRLELLEIDGRRLGVLDLQPSLDVPPYTGEPFAQDLDCAGLAADASELVYRLEGRIDADEPRSHSFPFNHRSRLLPVPGLDGVYR